MPASANTELKQVTVLCAYVSSPPPTGASTAAGAERFPVEQVRPRLEAVIQRFGGILDRQASAAEDERLVAWFGVPTAREDDPKRSIRAALALQAEVAALYPLQTAQVQEQVRVGISTGAIRLESNGAGDGPRATGEPLQVAITLSRMAPTGGIVIAADTYRHVAEQFDVVSLESVAVAGSRKVNRYLVQGERPRAFHGPRGVQGMEIPLVGRGAELRTLRDAFDETLARGEPTVITMVGEAGVGKTRLLYEFDRWVEPQGATVRFFKGRAGPQMSNRPYALMRDLFAFRFGIREGESPVMARVKLEQGARKFTGTGGTEKIHFMGHLLGFDFTDSPYLGSSLHNPRQMRDRAFLYTAQFFASMTTTRTPSHSRAVSVMGSAGREDQPLVVIFLEDVHWADDGSLDLVEYLVRESQGVPLLLVVTTRPSLWERRPTWGREFGSAREARLNLPPLTLEESHHLADTLLQRVATVPPELPRLLVERTDGNPFYMEELVKMLLEEEIILVPEGAQPWQVVGERLAEVEVPPSLVGVFQARMDSLPRQARETLQRAAVVGRVFWDKAVEQLFGEMPNANLYVQSALQLLQAREFIIERQTSAFEGTREFVFKHTLLQEVAYGSIVAEQVPRYHAQIAAWLTKVGAEGWGNWAGLIAEQAERADQGLQAAVWYRRAGKQAQESYVPEAAIRYYQRALHLLDLSDIQLKGAGRQGARLRVRLYEGLGEMLRGQTRYGEAEEAYHGMLEAARVTNDTMAQIHARIGLALVYDRQGAYRQGLESAEQAETLAQRAGAELEVVRAWFRKSTLYYRLGNPKRALALVEQALTLSMRLKARPEIAFSLDMMGWMYGVLGNDQMGAHYLKQALEVYAELGDRASMMHPLNLLGENARLRGDYRIAVAFYQDALTLARELNDRERQLVYLSNLGGARVGMGEYQRAETDLLQVIRQAEQAGRTMFLSETYRFLAEAYLGQGKVEETIEAAQRALEMGRRTERHEHMGAAWRVLGMAGATDDLPPPDTLPPEPTPTHPRSCFMESLRIFTDIGAEGEQARTLWAWADYERRIGDAAQGDAMWQQALDLFTRLGMEMEARRMSDRW